ncbi:MAG: FecR domain-containing protein [Phenylobacterium sp.]|uniref:FecR domain-containing protein n=1 Tax=Phenylobacterium sp. TaxID=1871053 RepID=UPI002721746C|nr:FecR domain-containing protein [Phenylobacterium sp.]MDO8910370.1 FecR domain-containing protein [Phenylobacterium sp.]MDP3102349.1 FecR domain-containing protein [Phenylobacterium sp.]
MRRTALFFACSVLAFAAGSAQAAAWRLVEVNGTVRITVPGAEVAPARLNQTVPTGSSITTTLGARAALDNGLQQIVVGPNSRMTVAPDAGGFTRVMQDLGAVMFKVDKQKSPHFRVDTPLLAAIVKGTTFTVVVGPMSDAVNVAEGLVEVRSNGSDLGSDVGAGSSGAVSRDAPQSVQVTGTVTPTAGAPEAVKIEPLDYKTVSGGLVDSGGPTMIANEAGAITSGNGAASAAMGAETVGPAALPIEVAQNDRQLEASDARGGNGPADGGGAALTNGAGSNGNGGGPPENPGTNGPGNGNSGNGGATAETGNTGSNGNSGGNNGNGNGNGGVAAETGNTGSSGNGGGNGNGGAATETGNAGSNGNGGGNTGNGNGNGGTDGLVAGLISTVGGVAEDVTGNGKGRGSK